VPFVRCEKHTAVRVKVRFFLLLENCDLMSGPQHENLTFQLLFFHRHYLFLLLCESPSFDSGLAILLDNSGDDGFGG